MSRWNQMFSRRKRMMEDLDQDIRDFIERETQDNIERGMAPQEARYAALRKFGNVTRVREETWEVWSFVWLEQLWQDVRYGIRTLVRDPGFTLVASLIIALGIGVSTALFSVFNGVLLNPLPYWQPEQLVAVYWRTPDNGYADLSYPNFLDCARENRSFSALAAYNENDFNLTGIGDSERIAGEMVSAAFFPLLGVQPRLGRTFLPDEDQPGARPVVLVSEGLWKRKLGSSPDALGKALTLSGTVYTIVGVIPANFSYVNFHRSDVYTPIGQWNNALVRDRRAGLGTYAVGRLKPGISFERAKADMDVVGRHLAEAYPDADKGSGIQLVPLKQTVVGGIQPVLVILLAAVGFVLLIACVNVANLLLARSTGRRQEFAVRAALGAGRGRIIMQLLTQSTILALVGGGLGLLIAAGGTQSALQVLPEALPGVEQVHVDGRVLLFTLAISALASILFGLAPALKTARADLHETLKEGGRGSDGPRHRVQRVFVVVEMALALVLLAGAGLMVRSLANLWNVDLGFDPHNVLTFSLSFPSTLNSPTAIRTAWSEIQKQLRSAPGVQAASVRAASVPLGVQSVVPIWLEGEPKPPTQTDMKLTLFYLVQSDYLKVMKTPVQRGRFFNIDDNEHSPSVMVIDESFASLYFPNQNPLGKHVNFDVLNIRGEIVGIVRHIKQGGPEEGEAAPECYLPISQIPDRFIPLMAQGVDVAVRTNHAPLLEVGPIRHALQQFDSQLVMYNPNSLDGAIAGSLAARRFAVILLGIFAVLALLLSCVGIYGVISYLAGQRTHEIGIRVALGAGRRDVLRMVLGGATKMALLGVAIGLVATFALTRLMASMLFGVSAHDPLTLAGAAILLVVVALTGCYIPARKATKVDPMVALRYE